MDGVGGPRAETSKLLFPSLRFCIVSPTDSVGGPCSWFRILPTAPRLAQFETREINRFDSARCFQSISRVECGDGPSVRQSPGKLLRARGGMGHHEFGV